MNTEKSQTAAPQSGYNSRNAMRTFRVKDKDIQREWLLYDADGAVLGRLAGVIAHRLRGKHKPTYSPDQDVGDFVVVVNAEKIRVTGKKEDDKMYYRHSGYPGGLRATSVRRVRQTHPERLLRNAVRGMLPKCPLGRRMLLKLKVYAGPTHPHVAQSPRAQEQQ